MQTVRIQPVAGGEQRRYLLGEPRLDRLRTSSGRPFGTRRQRGDLGKPRRKHPPQPLAFLPTHLDEIGKGLLKSYKDRRLRRAPILLALVLLGDVDDSFQGQQAIEAWRRRLNPP